jgi:PREDICTED: hypothetical protein
MKTTLQNFFKSKKNKVICFSILVLTILASAGFYLNLQAQEQKKQDQARIEKEKAEEEAKKEQEEKEKIELAKAEEEKAKVEQQKAEVDKREKDNFVENKSNSTKKETQKNSNSTSKKTENSKKNKKKDNNNNNNNSNKDNTFEVEGDGYPTVLGNSGRFFSSKSEADNWAFAQLENDDSNWSKSGYRRFSTSQCKRNGQIGWTVNFRK